MILQPTISIEQLISEASKKITTNNDSSLTNANKTFVEEIHAEAINIDLKDDIKTMLNANEKISNKSKTMSIGDFAFFFFVSSLGLTPITFILLSIFFKCLQHSYIGL